MLKKLLCVLLAALLLVGTLASCATGDTTTDTTAGANVTTNAEDETREPLEIPDTRYDGMELCFLTRDEGEWSTVEIFAEDQTLGPACLGVDSQGDKVVVGDTLKPLTYLLCCEFVVVCYLTECCGLVQLDFDLFCTAVGTDSS